VVRRSSPDDALLADSGQLTTRSDSSMESLKRCKSLFRRPPTPALAAFEARKPAVCFCRSEQASIAVAAVGILAELAQTIRRHRAGLQRQARCFAQQIRPSRSAHCRRTAHDARGNLDRAEIAATVRPLRSREWCGSLLGELARNLAKQPFQYFDHDGAPMIDPATLYGIRKCVCDLSFNLLFPPTCREFCAPPSIGTVPQADSHRRPSMSIAMGASQHAAVS